MNESTIGRFLRIRQIDWHRTDQRGEDPEAAWRAQMMPYQVRMLEKHDREVAEMAQRMWQQQ